MTPAERLAIREEAWLAWTESGSRAAVWTQPPSSLAGGAFQMHAPYIQVKTAISRQECDRASRSGPARSGPRVAITRCVVMHRLDTAEIFYPHV